VLGVLVFEMKISLDDFLWRIYSDDELGTEMSILY
jgi:hypothetical protein